MKTICLALGVVLPVVLSVTAFSSADDEPDGAPPKIVVLRSAGDPAGAEHDVVMEVKTEVNGEDGDVLIHGTGSPMFVSVASPADPNRGWLGVQLGQVPPVLAAHLPTGGGAGILVGNIVKGSPADQAGVQQHDVITAVNGKSVTGDIGKLTEVIGTLPPGAKVSIKALREGREVALQATLASKPAGEEIEWKHEFAPDAEIHESIKTTGKLLRRDKDGKMVLEDLGDLQMLKNLPADIRAFIPKMDELTTKVWVDDENRSFSSVITRDDNTISVQQDNGGEIMVKRADKDGKSTEASYANAEALAAADSEAFEIYQEAQTGVVEHSGPGKFKQFRFNLDLEGHEEWREQIHKAMQEAREAVQGAQKSVDDTKKRFQFRFGKAPGHPFFSWNDDEGGPKAFGMLGMGSRPGTSFRVNPDGQIEVIIRKGDTEVTKVFKDEADLAARDTELHAAYTEVMSEDEE